MNKWFSIAVLEAAFIFGIGCGFLSPKRAINTIDLVDYSDALKTCRQIGRETKSYQEYEKCANDTDKHFGVDAGR